MIVLAVAIPFGVFAGLRAANPTGDQEPVPLPTDLPSAPLDFPFGSSTTVSTTLLESTTTSFVTTTAARPQCSDGRDNDRDGRIDLSDLGCSSRSDRSEFNAVTTTRAVTTTLAPVTTTIRPSTTTSRITTTSSRITTTTRRSTTTSCVPRTYPLPTRVCSN